MVGEHRPEQPSAHSRCPLCSSEETVDFYSDRHRPYRRCQLCQLIFVPPSFFLTHLAEKAEYDLHRNAPDDPRYRRFLSRLCDPLSSRLPPASHGLDFGSGPGPTLSVMLEDKGHRVDLYDPFYAHDPSVFRRRYDFISASEVVEHLQRPRQELERLWRCLKPGGLLGIMTKLALDREAFARWHYRQDRTHVCFFARETFDWLARHWQTEAVFVDADVILLCKPSVVLC